MTEADENVVGIAGAGAWGTALAACLAASGRAVRVWGRTAAATAEIENTRSHPALPGFRAQPGIRFGSDAAILKGARSLIIALPAQSIRHAAPLLQSATADAYQVILAAKGLELGSGHTMPELGRELWPHSQIAMLSGPTFATELALGLPGAATLAADEVETAKQLAALFRGGPLRLYASDDVTGVAIGGAVKNVLAIAAGAVMGAGLGANARAAMISRGLAEMTRLGVALGAKPETLAGLSGLGDVVLSCTDAQSRNYSLGYALGSGKDRPEALTEGAHTVEPLLQIAAAHNIDVPIATAVDAVLNRGVSLQQAVAALMSRPGGTE